MYEFDARGASRYTKDMAELFGSPEALAKSLRIRLADVERAMRGDGLSMPMMSRLGLDFSKSSGTYVMLAEPEYYLVTNNVDQTSARQVARLERECERLTRVLKEQYALVKKLKSSTSMTTVDVEIAQPVVEDVVNDDTSTWNRAMSDTASKYVVTREMVKAKVKEVGGRKAFADMYGIPIGTVNSVVTTGNKPGYNFLHVFFEMKDGLPIGPKTEDSEVDTLKKLLAQRDAEIASIKLRWNGNPVAKKAPASYGNSAFEIGRLKKELALRDAEISAMKEAGNVSVVPEANTRTVTCAQVKEAVDKAGGVNAFASAHGFSYSSVANIISGRQNPGKRYAIAVHGTPKFVPETVKGNDEVESLRKRLAQRESEILVLQAREPEKVVVDRIVEVPVTVEVEKVVEVRVEVPVVETKTVEVEKVVEVPFETFVYIPKSSEKRDAAAIIKAEVEHLGFDRFCDEYDITPAHVQNVIDGKGKPGPEFAAGIGMQVIYGGK